MNLPKRKQNRLQNYDYSDSGAYFITICTEERKSILSNINVGANIVLEGYKSYNMFGDSLERQVDFEKPLEDLEGKPIRLKFCLKDCHLYSFCFK